MRILGSDKGVIRPSVNMDVFLPQSQCDPLQKPFPSEGTNILHRLILVCMNNVNLVLLQIPKVLHIRIVGLEEQRTRVFVMTREVQFETMGVSVSEEKLKVNNNWFDLRRTFCGLFSFAWPLQLI